MNSKEPFNVDSVVGRTVLDPAAWSKEVKRTRTLTRPLKSKPWLVPEAITCIEAQITLGMEVLETGAGGSTLWFAERVKTVVSFEHEWAWYNKVNDIVIEKNLLNVTLIYAPGYPVNGISGIDGKFDIIMIDGRGRVKSIETTWHMLKPGGLFILDNSERPRYRAGVTLLNNLGWPCGKFGSTKWQTSIWSKP